MAARWAWLIHLQEVTSRPPNLKDTSIIITHNSQRVKINRHEQAAY
jgi:hypothetical protein